MATKKKALKKSKLRHAEYYDFQKIQDKLYAESMDGKMFTKLVEITPCRKISNWHTGTSRRIKEAKQQAQMARPYST